MTEVKLEKWDTNDHIDKVASEFNDLITTSSNKFGPEATLQALSSIVGRWFSNQDQAHINGQGLNQNQLMHYMVEYYFQRG